MFCLLRLAQIVSTFLKSLDIPWPSIFGTIMARVSVVNLNLVQLPKTACLNPNPSFYSQFNGYTLGLVAAMLGAGVLHLFGTHVLARITLRNMPAAEREERLAKFHSTVLARALLVRSPARARSPPKCCAPDVRWRRQVLYVVYPGVRCVAARCACASSTLFEATRPDCLRSMQRGDLLHILVYHASERARLP